jgi:sec-independent protein translocase protein TatB
MLFGVGPLELGVLLLLGVVLLGPDKMPGYARDAARLLKKVRTMADEATKDIREEMGPEFKDLDPRSLHPRALIQKHILDPAWADDDEPSAAQAQRAAAAAAATSAATIAAASPSAGPPVQGAPMSSPPAGPAPEGTPWDADAT